MICANSHCFDFSSKGYVNFVPNQKQEFKIYPKELFKSRASVFESGAYDKVFNEIRSIISSNFEEGSPLNVLDAGCGEGYFAAKLSEIKGISVFGADISRDAIQGACRRKKHVKWIVADVSRLPIRERSIKVILNVLAIANYEEFKRVLTEDGLIVKIVPGSEYLKEIREIMKPRLSNKIYSNKDVIENFERHTEVVEKRNLRYKVRGDHDILRHFIEMTPMTRGLDPKNSGVNGISHITIDMDIIVGKPG